MRMSFRLGLLAVAMTAVWATAGCGGDDFDVREVPSLSVRFQIPPDGEVNGFTPGTKLVLKNPGVDKISELDIIFYNLGEQDMRLLNVYIADGSNKYVDLIWPENDPKGENIYTTNEEVRSCVPDRTTVSDAALLPDAQNPNPTDCIFPITIAGSTQANLFDSRKLRLRYTFDSAKDEVDKSPVKLIIHIDNKEDKLSVQGVVELDVSVEACTGTIQMSTPGLQFLSASPVSPETQEICLSNAGCEELKINDVYLDKESNEFTLLGVAQIKDSTLPAVTVDPEANVCFQVRYHPVDGTSDQNRIVVESSDSSQPKAFIDLESGGCTYAVEVTHSDDLESGALPLNFSDVSYPGTGKKIINVRNVGGDNACPVSLTSIEISPQGAWISKGGTLCAEIKQQGTSKGGVGGCPGVGAPNVVVLGKQDDTVDVEVNYVPLDGNAGSGGQVKLNLKKNAKLDVPPIVLDVIAGEVQPQLAVGPAQQQGTIGQLEFVADVGEVKCATVALYNYGYKSLMLTDVTLSSDTGQATEDYALTPDPGIIDDGGKFVPQELGEQGLVPVTVCFKPTSASGFSPKGWLRVWTDNPDLPPDTPEASFSLKGKVGPSDDLPTASLGTSDDYAGHKAGDTITLSASATDGKYPADNSNGYSFWLTAKPDGSAAKLNTVGQGPNPSFVVDTPGTYTVNANVFAVGQEAGAQVVLVSDPVSVDIVVE